MQHLMKASFFLKGVTRRDSMFAVFGAAQSFIVTGEGVTTVDLIQEKTDLLLPSSPLV